MWPFKKYDAKPVVDDLSIDVVTHDGEFYRQVMRSSSYSVSELDGIAKDYGLLAINQCYSHLREPRGWIYDFVKLKVLTKGESNGQSG